MNQQRGITRREMLATMSAAAASAGLSSFCASEPAHAAGAGTSAPKNILPRWRGANLLEKFYSDKSGKRPGKPFVERDFEWLARWGFNFVRLPMDYRFWTALPDRRKFKESVLKEIDQAVDWGRQYGIHVNINFHRAPGYCVNRPELEPFNLWTDAEAQEICELHWSMFAERYKDVSSKSLSFNLWNEPGALDRRGLTRKGLEKLVRRIVGAIRQHNPDRLVIADGPSWGKVAMPELADLKIGQSTRAYQPFKLTHYRASWVNSKGWPEPTWPLQDGKTRWDIDKLREHYRPWLDLMAKGVGVHCGEGGVYRYTPHKVVLGFLRDVLTVLKEYNIGWAMWNMRGGFGWIDSNRNDVKYEDLDGHKLDRKMLDLLKAH